MFIRHLIALLWIVYSFSHVAAIGEVEGQIPGRIALVGADFNVYSYDFSSTVRYPLSNDATRIRHYQWPTWSTDGRIAFFCCDGRVIRTPDAQAYISADGYEAANLVYTGADASIIYAYWSPQNCDDGEECRDLAMLVSDFSRNSLSVDLLRNRAAETTSQRIEFGSPFYYSWNSAGTQILFHRNNREITIYDVAAGGLLADSSVESSGLYQTPVWSPLDNSVLIGIEGPERRSTDLVIRKDGNQIPLLTGVRGFLSFLWSPDGKYIAYRSSSQSGISPIHVIDVATGAVVAVTPNEDVIAFFWSPDSQKIAYVTFPVQTNRSAGIDQGLSSHSKEILVQQEAGQQLLWHIFDVASASNVTLAAFTPTYEMRYMLIYFDQFAPSHRIWSPDSQYIVYASEQETGPEIQIISIAQDSVPLIVSDGVFAAWSFD